MAAATPAVGHSYCTVNAFTSTAIQPTVCTATAMYYNTLYIIHTTTLYFYAYTPALCCTAMQMIQQAVLLAAAAAELTLITAVTMKMQSAMSAVCAETQQSCL